MPKLEILRMTKCRRGSVGHLHAIFIIKCKEKRWLMQLSNSNRSSGSARVELELSKEASAVKEEARTNFSALFVCSWGFGWSWLFSPTGEPLKLFNLARKSLPRGCVFVRPRYVYYEEGPTKMAFQRFLSRSWSISYR